MTIKMADKKQSLISRLFSSRKSSVTPHDELTPEENETLKNIRLNRIFSVDATTFRNPNEAFAHELNDTSSKNPATTPDSLATVSLHQAGGAKNRPSSAVTGSNRKQSLSVGSSSKKLLQPETRRGHQASSSDRLRPKSASASSASPRSPVSAPVMTGSGITQPSLNVPSTKPGRKASLQTPTKSPFLSPLPNAAGSGSSGVGLCGEQNTRGGRMATTSDKKLRHKKATGRLHHEDKCEVKVDTSKPLDFPATPEKIYEYHRHKPFLNRNEEWLIVELNAFECLVDSIEIIKIIAKHSKFFEVEPDQLWAEFFEFVEDVPSYDEIINYDVWQEFRDQKYPC